MNLDLSFESIVFYDPGKPDVSIDIELSLKGLMVSIPARVDTGASHCVFARVHGERLGLDIESGEPLLMSTATGSFRTSGHWVTLSAGEFSFDSMVFFAYDENFTRNVLGRHGWLDRMIVGINDYDGKLYLSRYR